MASVDDAAADMELFHTGDALKVRKHTLPHIGYCHNCSEQIELGVFCNRECAEDYERAHDSKIRDGRL